MALIKCKECGHEVSNKATSCPNCGAPIKKAERKTSTFTWLVLVAIGLAIWIQSSKETSSTYQKANQTTVTNQEVKTAKTSMISNGAKEKFKQWAMENTAVTFINYPENSDWQIWVRLKSEKYTTEENIEEIALSLARYYKLQTGFEDSVIVTVWHSYRDEIVAKGRL